MSAADQSYTINEFCTAERISRAMFYKLRAAGKGPRIFYVGDHPRISHEARIEWRRQLEAEALKVRKPGGDVTDSICMTPAPNAHQKAERVATEINVEIPDFTQ
jgi:hypothetical protein